MFKKLLGLLLTINCVLFDCNLPLCENKVFFCPFYFFATPLSAYKWTQ